MRSGENEFSRSPGPVGQLGPPRDCPENCRKMSKKLSFSNSFISTYLEVFRKFSGLARGGPNCNVSEGEKPPKIRKKKKFPGTKFLGTFGPPPTEKTEKIGKIKGTLVRKVPGNLRSQEFVFFLVRFFCPLILCNFRKRGGVQKFMGNKV